jgi:hypothetical protein
MAFSRFFAFDSRGYNFRSAHLALIISEFPSVPSLRVVWMPDRRIGSVEEWANSV